MLRSVGVPRLRLPRCAGVTAPEVQRFGVLLEKSRRGSRISVNGQRSSNLESCLASISEFDGEFHIWEELFDKPYLTAVTSGSAVDAKRLLDGVVVGIKDLYDFAGRPPGNGSTITPGTPPVQHAAIVQRLLDAGAIIVGTTRMSEYAYSRSGPTRNPHGSEYTPGGSSSGSAAAVAAGMAQVAIGTQTKASTIRPASYCGVYGFKPTLGAISLAGATRLSTTLDHPGIFADSAVNLKRAFDALVGCDPADPVSCHLPQQFDAPVRKVGYFDLRGSLDLDTDMTSHFEAYVSNLSALGYTVEEVMLPVELSEIERIWQGVFTPEARHQLRHLRTRSDYSELGEEVRALLEAESMESLGGYFDLLDARNECGHRMDTLLASYDLVVLPSDQGAAPRLRAPRWDPACTTFTSALGLPAASIPMGVNRVGLPLGLQVVGRRHSDERVLSALLDLPASFRLATMR